MHYKEGRGRDNHQHVQAALRGKIRKSGKTVTPVPWTESMEVGNGKVEETYSASGINPAVTEIHSNRDSQRDGGEYLLIGRCMEK